MRCSYESRNNANIHLIIQDYGKGKSHFAVVVANFFQNALESQEVQGILQQIEVAAGTSKAVAERFKAYKRNQQRPHLVLCLSGDKAGDLRKQFLEVLLNALEAEGVEDTLAQHLCYEPLRYLENLGEQQRVAADSYLESIGNPDGDLRSLIQLLRDRNLQVIPRVKELVRHLTEVTPDFTSEIEIDVILKDLIENLCQGENQRFQGILILFDELNYYLTSWATDQMAAGHKAPQHITNICERYKGKITLLSLTQIPPLKAVGISAHVTENYKKVASRFAPQDSTYNPISSLELVVDNLLVQEEDETTQIWQNFYKKWQNTLREEARTAYEKRVKLYKEQKGWKFEKFYRHLGKGVFPLHPLTAYLLCNLEFTQDRTAIQFIKGYTKKFIEQHPIEEAGKLNYIYPIDLVDSFVDNFSNASVYEAYRKAYNLAVNSENPDEVPVLKALFLYYATGDKIAKTDREPHEDIIKTLTGLKSSKIKAALRILEQKREVIYYRPETRIYQFFEGINPGRIQEEIEEEVKERYRKNPNYDPFPNFIVHCNQNIHKYLQNKVIAAKDFVRTYQQIEADWQFENKVYTISNLLQTLKKKDLAGSTPERGIVAYALAENQEDLQELRRTLDQHLNSSSIQDQIAIAIPADATGDLASLLLKLDILNQRDSAEKRLYGAAYTQLKQRWEEQLDKQLGDLFANCTYHSMVNASNPNDPQSVVSALLEKRYPGVLSIESQDKMRSNHPTGTKIVRYLAIEFLKQGYLSTPFSEKSYKTVIDQIFTRRWDLLKPTSQKYLLQVPTDENVRVAWEKISELTDLQGESKKTIRLQALWETLSAPPFGCSEYLFVVLLTAWMAYHRKEIMLYGPVGIPKKNKSVPLYTQSLREWASVESIWQKPRDFVHQWVKHPQAKLIRQQRLAPPELPSSPINYDQAQEYLGKAQTFLNSNEPDPTDVKEVKETEKQVKEKMKPVQSWFKPVDETEKLPPVVALDSLLPLYTKLLQPPPTLNLRSDVLTVTPTHQQRDRHDKALETLRTRLADCISTHAQKAETLATPNDCTTYKQETEAKIKQLGQLSPCPPHLIEQLNNALQVADRSQVKGQIQSLYRNLDEHATQGDYTQTRTDIEARARSLPDSAKSDIENILQDLTRRYEELCQMLATWEEQAASVTSKNQILDLIKEITHKERYFTEADSQQRIKTLQHHLEQELLKVEQQDNTEKSIRGELASIQQKLQRIRDLPFARLKESFQVYQELVQSQLSITETPTLAQQYAPKLDELDKLKTQGRTVMAEKFAQLGQRSLTRLDDYEVFKQKLTNSIELLQNYEEFAESRDILHKALQNLDIQYQQLEQQQVTRQKEKKDAQIMQQIRSIQSSHYHTIAACKVGIEEINTLKTQLHFLQPVEAEIQQVLTQLQKKIQKYYDELARFEEFVTSTNHLTEARKNYEFFLQKFHFYANSTTAENRYNTIKSDLGLLVELFQFTALPQQTISDYQNLLNQLNHWQEKQELSPALQYQYETLVTTVENQRNALYLKKQEAAKQWVKDLGKRVACEVTPPAISERNKLESAHDILEQLEREKPQYLEFLSETHRNSLTHIKKYCKDEQEKHLENQIITSFKKLPRLQRQKVYKKLGNYLDHNPEA
ncbi:hypothetical protein PN462_13565 [Spirulina sp. CS-785/01]|uniref:hypothetical protein n=1 Tax=Spirulina sp. CS-785/01 TaxID=3021716 RepID=UPI00232D7E8B|nr:hypothetical protein [Spirulina sp. CS-785/01]MDB9314134.1 hypothetical protein [Spirulina sp. CS-785/01]